MMQTYRHTYHICITRVNRTSVYGTLLVDGSLLSCSRASGIPFRPFATTATTNAPRAEGPKGHWSNVKSNAFIIIITHYLSFIWTIWTYLDQCVLVPYSLWVFHRSPNLCKQCCRPAQVLDAHEEATAACSIFGVATQHEANGIQWNRIDGMKRIIWILDTRSLESHEDGTGDEVGEIPGDSGDVDDQELAALLGAALEDTTHWAETQLRAQM